MKQLGRTTFSTVLCAMLVAAPLAMARADVDDDASTTNIQQIDDEVSFAVSNACRYDVRVSGTIRRIETGAMDVGATSDEEALYRPDLTVRTTLSCGSSSSTATFEGIGDDAHAMTAPQLARHISRMSAFHRSDGWESCAFTPSVRLDDAGLAFGGVRMLCRPFRAISI